MKKRGLVGLFVIIKILIVTGLFWIGGEATVSEDEERACVPASCCHASSCVWEDEAPECDAAFCTLSCEPGTLDCGAGECGIVEGQCGVVWNE